MEKDVKIITDNIGIGEITTNENALFCMDVENLLDNLPEEPIFDLVVTSPPYNIGKSYEKKIEFSDYIEWQRRIIRKIHTRLKPTGNICWITGNYIMKNGSIIPIDTALDSSFRELGMSLRNRIVWHYGHGLHCKKRFSGRYETVMWYTNTEDYTFNLDPVRVPQKYTGKTYTKGKHKGELSCNPLGKNPEDVWDDIPNVKSHHIEKTIHPCQFPVGLAERLVLSLSNAGELVFDPFAGVASSGVASIIHDRYYWGCEIKREYIDIGRQRLVQSLYGTVKYRENKPVGRSAIQTGRPPSTDVKQCEFQFS